MSLVVLSNNIYLQKALREIYREKKFSADICVIDLESFNSLLSIRNELSINSVGRSYRIVILRGKGLCSKVLSSLCFLPEKPSIFLFERAVQHGYELSKLLDVISACRSLAMLTKKEINVAMALLYDIEIKKIAFDLRVDERKIYQRMGTAANKLNLKTGKEFIFFMRQEFLGRDADLVALPH